MLARARSAAAPTGVQSIVVLDTAAKADFAQFRDAGFDSYLVRPVRPRSVLTHVGGLPAGDPAAVAGPLQPQASRIDRALPLQVLLVEDNDINALLARRMLEKAGCAVRLAVNGREAVDAMHRVLAGVDAPYDLVLMDSHMPVLDGLEATRQIKRLFGGQGALRTPPIIAVTANAFDDDRRRCLEAGMDDYLAKPFDREGLLRVLNHWCPADKSASAA